jgi:hypothetical protein
MLNEPKLTLPEAQRTVGIYLVSKINFLLREWFNVCVLIVLLCGDRRRFLKVNKYICNVNKIKNISDRRYFFS